MIRLLLLCSLVGLLFWLLPAGPAVAWSVIPGLLLAGVLYDAIRRGRVLLGRRREQAAGDEATNLAGQFLIVHALWLGLHAPAAGHESVTTGIESIGGDLELTGFDGGIGGGDSGGF